MKLRSLKLFNCTFSFDFVAGLPLPTEVAPALEEMAAIKLVAMTTLVWCSAILKLHKRNLLDYHRSFRCGTAVRNAVVFWICYVQIFDYTAVWSMLDKTPAFASQHIFWLTELLCDFTIPFSRLIGSGLLSGNHIFII